MVVGTQFLTTFRKYGFSQYNGNASIKQRQKKKKTVRAHLKHIHKWMKKKMKKNTAHVQAALLCDTEKFPVSCHFTGANFRASRCTSSSRLFFFSSILVFILLLLFFFSNLLLTRAASKLHPSQWWPKDGDDVDARISRHPLKCRSWAATRIFRRWLGPTTGRTCTRWSASTTSSCWTSCPAPATRWVPAPAPAAAPWSSNSAIWWSARFSPACTPRSSSAFWISSRTRWLWSASAKCPPDNGLVLYRYLFSPPL